MEIPDRLHCLFSADVEQQDGTHTLEVPKREVRIGSLEDGETYRVALLPAAADGSAAELESEPEPDTEADTGSRRERDASGPPVDEGETRTVEIEDLGDQGDGITRVERGFVVIVPDTEQGERVTVEVTDVRDNVAFAEVIERESYYD